MNACQLDWLDQRQQRVTEAQRRLAAMVERNRQSFECRDFTKRRQAALQSRPSRTCTHARAPINGGG